MSLLFYRKTSIFQKPEFAFLREIAQTIPDVSSAADEGGDTDGGEASGPVDFSVNSRINPQNSRLPRSVSVTSSSTVSTPPIPGVLNLSNNSPMMIPNHSGMSLPPATGQPRQRGRPRKRPLPDMMPDAMMTAAASSSSAAAFTPAGYTAAGESFQKHPRISFAPGQTVTMPSSSSLFGMPGGGIASTISSSPLPPPSSSSLEALTNVIAMQQQHWRHPSTSSSQQQQQPQFNHNSSRRQQPTKVQRSNSDYSDSADNYDNGHGGDDQDDDSSSTDEDEEETEEDEYDDDGESDRAIAGLGTTRFGGFQSRTSVLVPNPISLMTSSTSATATATTASNEDDDYDNI